MPNLIILGTIGIDTLKTPFGTATDVLGGSSMFASCAASLFAQPGVISIKGEDLEDSELDFLRKKGVNLEGITTEGKNFRWSGEYEFDMNAAKTLKTELNSLMTFEPNVPESYKGTEFLFVANIDPEKQLKVIKEIGAKEVLLDTMNFWIESKKEELLETIKHATIFICNDGEARELFGTANLMHAAKEALKLGVKAVIIKKGEHGSLLFTKDEFFNCPGYPLENLIDPTGCGDTFGGTFLAYYAKTGDMRKAMVYASVLASFTAEGFGISRLKDVTLEEIEERFKEMKKLREF